MRRYQATFAFINSGKEIQISASKVDFVKHWDNSQTKDNVMALTASFHIQALEKTNQNPRDFDGKVQNIQVEAVRWANSDSYDFVNSGNSAYDTNENYDIKFRTAVSCLFDVDEFADYQFLEEVRKALYESRNGIMDFILREEQRQLKTNISLTD